MRRPGKVTASLYLNIKTIARDYLLISTLPEEMVLLLITW